VGICDAGFGDGPAAGRREIPAWGAEVADIVAGLKRISPERVRTFSGHARAGDNAAVTAGEGESGVFRDAGISYMRIPARDPGQAATFYRNVFGWRVDANRPDPSFEDGSGHVIGHFIADQRTAGEAGVRPYVYVEHLDETLEKIADEGGQIVAAPYPEGDLWVATFRDPAGNVLGVWQRGPRVV
jgi:hypothetical protein